jgi:O-antigen ligase
VKVLLSLLVLFLIVAQTFSIDASLAPGLSVKNAMLYALAASLLVRIVVSGRFKPDLIGMQVSFVFLIVYAIVSWLIVLFAIQYPGYELITSMINLKTAYVDHAVFFIVFFYGARTLEDALGVADALAAGAVVANGITVLDTSGILGLNIIPVRTENIYEIGRVQGAFGEANGHAAVVVLLLPLLVAKTLSSRGAARVFWASGVLFSLAALLMTASRGAMVGIVLASLWGAYVFRRFVSLGRFAGWVGAGVLVVTIVIVSLSATYTDLLADRVLGITFSGNASDASSGRTTIWVEALKTMMESPWAFITGFGFDSYSTMGFEYAPHNTYLNLWFNLGLPGLLAFVLVIVQATLAARSAAEIAGPVARPYLMAFVVGFLALCVTIFFVELHEPWLYTWAFTGLMMRAVVCVRQEQADPPAPAGVPPPEAIDAAAVRGLQAARARRTRPPGMTPARR